MEYLDEMNYIAKTVFFDELHDYWDADGEKLDLSKTSSAPFLALFLGGDLFTSLFIST